jgi:hypothetical protein
MRNAYRILVETPEGMGSLGIYVRRLEYNIKMGLKYIGYRLWN